MARIVTLGSALQDIYLVDRDDFTAANIGDVSIFGQIAIGSKIDIDRISFEIGGGGTNSAVTFARHGHETVFMGNIAHDPAGEAVMALLDQEGIDSSYVKCISRTHTGCSIILLDSKTGERTIMTYRGASAKFNNLDPDWLDEVCPDWLYITSMRGDMETLTKFLHKAKVIGCKVMINPGKLELERPHELLGLMNLIDILAVNKREAMQIVPGQYLPELAENLLNYVGTVIITDNSMGAIATNRKETYHVGLYEDVKVKDTTGAGDAFGSGFLARFASGHSFEESLIFASANSTSVITELGAKKGILTGTEKLHLMPIEKV
jgi:ribokinase